MLSFILKSFTRDGDKSFGSVGDAASLLSNNDSVLGRDGVKHSIAEYEGLFSGARKKVGTTSTADSIQNREKEYKTMVNSFYDLVTDFYEWGWGQVSHRYFNAFVIFSATVEFSSLIAAFIFTVLSFCTSFEGGNIQGIDLPC